MRRILVLLLLAGCLGSAGIAFAQGDDEIPRPAALRSGPAEIDLGTHRMTLMVTETARGPMIPIEPLANWAGAELEVGPLGKAHILRIQGREARFGPDSAVLVLDREVIELSQPPRVGLQGLEVPLDFLIRTLGDAGGWDWAWDATARRVTARRRAPRQLQLRPDLVHIPGVSTLVLQFSERPRYEIAENASGLEVSLLDDEIIPPPPVDPTGSFLDGLDVGRRGVRLRLEPGIRASHYELERPFRLVFDLQRSSEAAAPAIPEPTGLRRDAPGLTVVVVDPGHGGSETGTIGPGGAREKDLTLILARTLKRRLESRLPVRVLLTRDEDADLPHDLRTALANQYGADLFISIHLNSGGLAHGAETYFLSSEASDARAAASAEVENRGGGPDDGSISDLQLMLWDLAQSHHLSESQRFARLVQEELNQALGLRDRGVKQAPFRVLMGATMPAVLVELGFLSNPEEEERLGQAAYRADLVEALVRAVQRFQPREDSLGRVAEGSAPP